MSRLDDLEARVRELYEAKLPTRDGWADWLYPNHVLVVADYATKLAKQHGANAELARAAALLHDIGDVKLDRTQDEHEQVSLDLGRDIMRQTGYSEDDIKLVIDDAARYHSCHDGQTPASLEGKILATADSMAHLLTDFYLYAAWGMGQEGESFDEVKQWALKKIDRDLHDKIQFDDVRKQCQPDYDRIKALFGR